MKKTLSTLLILACSFGFAQESQAVKRLVKNNNATITISQSTNNPTFIIFPKGGNNLKYKSFNSTQRAQDFLVDNLDVFNLKSINDIKLVKEVVDNYGLSSVNYQQYYKGVPVYEGVLKFHFDANNNLTSINGNTISNIKISPIPTLSKEEAAVIAKKIIDKQNINDSKTPLEVVNNTLLVFPKNLVQSDIALPYLAYQLEVTNKYDVREYVFIDAHTGDLVDQFTGMHAIDRKLYEVNTNASSLKWKEGDPFPGELDKWQQNEVVTSEHVYNFFKNAFGYTSYNNRDASMITINNNPNIRCPNANWNGVTANYCTGTAADDVVAHEWGHAYTEYTSGLIYQYQSGALNESYSDVWGETIDLLNNYEDEGENLSVRTTNGCNESLRWKMGEDATAFGSPIRDMWNPNCNSNPSRVLDSAYYYCGTGDSGGVHLNSGVTNHLYALLVDGGSFNGQTIAKIGFVKAAHLWWRAQTTYLSAASNFSNFADALLASANDLIDVDLQGLSTTTTPAGLSGEKFTLADVQSVKNGIMATELKSSPVTQCGYVPLLSQTSVLCSTATDSPLFYENWENGLVGWTVSNEPTNSSSWINRNWEITAKLPGDRAGKGIFAIDPINGDCTTSMQNGILRLESPTISIPQYTGGKYEMAFSHYVATESTWDGGNIKFSLDGGSWTLVPTTAFTQNAYNSSLQTASAGNDNPLRGQAAFTGTDGGSLQGSWGQSIIDLSKLGVKAGSNVKFRFELGTDGCNGLDGWYIDEIYVYNCDGVLAVTDVAKANGLQVYPNPTSGAINIQNDKNLKIDNVEVYTTTGQLVQKINLNTNQKNTNLDLGKLNKGVYMLKINSNKETSSVKIIKK